ncbi:MAG: peptidase [Verrucomicrobiaceae bacterium]|nr:peptidase [Verrucomicrobiaceae bacterium]
MSDESDQDKTATYQSVVAGLAMIGFATWVVLGSGLFSSAPELTLKAQASLNKVAPDEALGSAAKAPVAAEKPTGVAPDAAAKDPLMAEIIGELKSETAVPNEALLTFKDKAALAKFLKRAKGYGLEVVGTLDGLSTVRVRMDSPQKLRDYLAASGPARPAMEANHWMNVPSLAKPDASNQGGALPSGTEFLQAVNATGERTEWGKGVTVAVLDTGVKANPTFGDNQVTHVDLVNDGTPFHSHGTSVASLIAGTDDRVPGVSPDASILDIRVANDKGYSVTSVLAQGILEAVNRGAQVLNISMGGYDDSQVLRQAVDYALQRGAIIVAAAGNEKYDQLAYPARLNGVISVGSVDAKGVQAYFSNSGSGLTYVAPGVGLPVAWDTDKMAMASGTSQSAAVVSGVAAYYMGLGLTSQNALGRMRASALPTAGTQVQRGFGIPRARY